MVAGTVMRWPAPAPHALGDRHLCVFTFQQSHGQCLAGCSCSTCELLTTACAAYAPSTSVFPIAMCTLSMTLLQPICEFRESCFRVERVLDKDGAKASPNALHFISWVTSNNCIYLPRPNCHHCGFKSFNKSAYVLAQLINKQ